MVETSHCLALFLLLFRGGVLASTNYKGYFDFDGGTFAYGNAVAFYGQMLNSTPIYSKEVVDDTECFRACVKDSRCRSTNLKLVEEQSGKFLCQLLDTDKFTSPEVFNGSSDFHHYSFTAPCELNPCMNGATCQPIKNKYDFKCICAPGYHGKLCNATYRSCVELLNAGYNKSGINVIKPSQSQSDTLNVSCDQTSRGGGWTMVFKVVSGLGDNIYQLWSSASPLNEEKTAILNTSPSIPIHYKNRLVPNWQTADPKEVRVALYENQNEVLSIVFNATNSDNENWFSANRVISSPWTDLTTSFHQFFSIPGDLALKRYFYIAGPYLTCAGDSGWLLIGGDACSWENRFPAGTIMYNKLTTAINMSDYANTGVADVLIVYIR